MASVLWNISSDFYETTRESDISIARFRVLVDPHQKDWDPHHRKLAKSLLESVSGCMLDRGQTWLDLTEDPTKYEMSRVASDIRSLWPLAAPVLSDPIRLHDLKAKFETWANTAIEEYWGPIR